MTTLSTTVHNPLVRALHSSGLLAQDLDYHVVRASMVIMFFFFGYQKWFPYEFERLVPFISNGPLIWWLYPIFGHACVSAWKKGSDSILVQSRGIVGGPLLEDRRRELWFVACTLWTCHRAARR